MAGQRYFPPLHGRIECEKCDIASTCPSCGKYQRDRRDVTFTSGRCPRLPDKKGFVDKSQRELYAEAVPLVHAQSCVGGLTLFLTLPGERRRRRVYRTKSGFWYFREKGEGRSYSKRCINFQRLQSREVVLREMALLRTDYCMFRAVVEDYCV